MKKGREELLLPHTEVLMEHGLTLIYAFDDLQLRNAI